MRRRLLTRLGVSFRPSDHSSMEDASDIQVAPAHAAVNTNVLPAVPFRETVSQEQNESMLGSGAMIDAFGVPATTSTLHDDNVIE